MDDRTRIIALALAFALGLAGPACGRDPAPAPGPAVASSVEHDGIRYTAETLVLESFPVQLHTVVTVTNAGTGERTVEMPGGCPVLLRAHPASADGGAPAWDQARDIVCTLQLMILRLGPGESRPITGGAGAGDVLGDSLPNGRYRLSALVFPDGGTLELPAGEVELAR
jgi:hypothetical protein